MRLVFTCREASALVSERMDRRLSAPERLGLWLHLWACAACRRFEAQVALLREAMRRFRA